MRILLIPAAVVLMAANWVVDYSASHLTFDAVQEGTPFTGKLVFEADITFDPKTLKGTVIVVTIPLKQTDAGTSDRNETLLTKDFFNVGDYPVATFESTEVVTTDKGFTANGTLTINGIRKPLSLPFTLKEHGESADVVGETTISRKDFNVGTGEWADEGTIGDKVVVKLNLVAKKV